MNGGFHSLVRTASFICHAKHRRVTGPQWIVGIVSDAVHFYNKWETISFCWSRSTFSWTDVMLVNICANFVCWVESSKEKLTFIVDQSNMSSGFLKMVLVVWFKMRSAKSKTFWKCRKWPLLDAAEAGNESNSTKKESKTLKQLCLASKSWSFLLSFCMFVTIWSHCGEHVHRPTGVIEKNWHLIMSCKDGASSSNWDLNASIPASKSMQIETKELWFSQSLLCQIKCFLDCAFKWKHACTDVWLHFLFLVFLSVPFSLCSQFPCSFEKTTKHGQTDFPFFWVNDSKLRNVNNQQTLLAPFVGWDAMCTLLVIIHCT